MTPVFEQLKTAARKRIRFNRTYSELRGMDRETGWDLGMFPEDARKTAMAQVYGR